jgi:hypothetical protein
MNITHDEAAAALRDVERTTARSFDGRVYRNGAIQLIGWGLIWLIGYGLSGWRPEWTGRIWMLLTPAGLVFSFTVARMRNGASSAGRTMAWRWWVTALVIFGFYISVYSLFRGVAPASYAAFPGLLVALIYCLVGGWRFTRFLWIGLALFALTLVGFFYVRPLIDYWMAVVGGGALMLGGVWLARA